MIKKDGQYSISAFSKNIAWEYYDGPIAGVLCQSSTRLSYRYQVIAWDNMQDWRFFALSEIPSERFEKFEMSLVQLGLQPKYPLWFIDLNVYNKDVEKQVLSICNLPFVPSAYIIAENLAQELVVSKLDYEGARMVENVMPVEEIQDLELWKKKLGI